MRGGGRAQSLFAAATLPQLIHLFTHITFVYSSEYGVPIEIKSWDAGRTPLGHMVDVTNGFGLKVLAEHNFLNDNNIAFSPYGLMGILVALYEGVDGESFYQIQRAMQLPWNRNVMRIGFRDIHRTLKTYFVPEEGFLAGLALNNENVTFNESYKKILRFYGFDLENDQLPTMTPHGNSSNETATVASTMTADESGYAAAATSTPAPVTGTESSTVSTASIDTKEETTPNPNVEMVTTFSTTTAGSSSAPNAESTTDISTSYTSDQSQLLTNTDIEIPAPTTQVTSATTISLPINTILPTTTNIPSTITSELTTKPPSTSFDTDTQSTQISQTNAAFINNPASDAETIDQQTSQATVAITIGTTSNNEIDNQSTAEIMSTTSLATEQPLITNDPVNDSTLLLTMTSDLQTPATFEIASTSTELPESNADDSTMQSNITTFEIPVTLAPEMTTSSSDATLSSTILTSNMPTSEMSSISTIISDASISDGTLTTTMTLNMPTSTPSEMSTLTISSDGTSSTLLSPSNDNTSTQIDVTDTIVTDSTTRVFNESALETLQRRKKSIVDFIFTNPPYLEESLYYRSYDIPPIIPGHHFDEKMFLANGLRNVQVTYMQYDTVLEHAYLPHLEASALRLPLDSDRYYLLVVLPRRGGGQDLGRLLARMARESDLSDVYNALRPRRVRGIVPSFTVKGHVTLTTDLQKLGIRDVFEPRQRDFTPMTRQPGVYVRSIEQAVSVAIRKYRPDANKKNRFVANRDPVKFYATYPFLYFVMDSSIHVSLMAGKMVDPLNSRIL